MDFDSYLPLAAIASVACPHTNFTGLTAPCYTTAEAYHATLIDGDGQKWQVSRPRTLEASRRLLTHGRTLACLAAISPPPPFFVPRPIKGTRLPGDLFALAHHAFPGQPISPALLEGNVQAKEFCRSLGHALGVLHSIPLELMQSAQLPYYSSSQVAQVWLQAIARIPEIPTPLRKRWESQLRDPQLWDFTPVLTHSNLQFENLYAQDGKFSAFTDFSRAAYSDPARDLSWIYASTTPENYEAFISAYQPLSSPDPALLAQRVALNSELNYVEWLCHEQREGHAAGAREALDAIFQLYTTLDEAGAFDLGELDTPASGTHQSTPVAPPESEEIGPK